MKELMTLAHKIAKATKALHPEFSYSECLKHGLKIAWRVVRRIDKTGEIYRVLLTNSELDPIENSKFITNSPALGFAYIDTPSADGGQAFYSFTFGFGMGFSVDCVITYAKHVRVTIGRNATGLFIKVHRGYYSRRAESYIKEHFYCVARGHIYYPDKFYQDYFSDKVKYLYNALCSRGFDVTIGKGVIL